MDGTLTDSMTTVWQAPIAMLEHFGSAHPPCGKRCEHNPPGGGNPPGVRPAYGRAGYTRLLGQEVNRLYLVEVKGVREMLARLAQEGARCASAPTPGRHSAGRCCPAGGGVVF